MPEEKIICKLTTPELQQRKSTVMAALQKQVMEKKEWPDGYSFKFNGTDLILDQLTDFIKAERLCCEFFTFFVKVADENSFIWLDIRGPEGTKDFMIKELGF